METEYEIWNAEKTEGPKREEHATLCRVTWLRRGK